MGLLDIRRRILLNTPHIETASGDIATFETDMVAPLHKLTVDIEPVQDLNGYDRPWPPGGGKNLAGPMEQGTVSESSAAGTTYGGMQSSSTTRIRAIDLYPIGSEGKAVVSFDASVYDIAVAGFDVDKLYLGRSSGWRSFQTTSPQTINWTDARYISVILRRKDSGTVTDADRLTSKLQVELGSTPTSYSTYSNICPIEGWEGMLLQTSGTNLLSGDGIIAELRRHFPGLVVSSTEENGRYFNFSASQAANRFLIHGDNFKENTQYTLIFFYNRATAGACNIRINYTDGTSQNLPAATTVPEFHITVSQENKTIDTIQGVNQGSNTSFYFDKCGIFEGVHTLNEYVPYTGTPYSIAFTDPSTGDPLTVYGGTLTVNADGSVDLVIKRFYLKISDWSTWNYYASGGYFRTATQTDRYVEGITCECYANRSISSSVANYSIGFAGSRLAVKDTRFTDVDSWLEEMGNYHLAINIPSSRYLHYHFDSIGQLITLRGTNNIWSDTGEVTAEFWKH